MFTVITFVAGMLPSQVEGGGRLGLRADGLGKSREVVVEGRGRWTLLCRQHWADGY